MPSKPRKGLPYFWATGIAKVLVGDQPCHLSVWLKGHLELPSAVRSAKFAEWKIAHTEMLTAVIQNLKDQGWKTTIEKYFRVTGTTGILGGKPDVIAQQAGKRPKILDCKSGEPRDSDVVQVQIYLNALPLAWKSPEMQFDGELIYKTHVVPVPHATAVGMRARMFEVLRQLSKPDRPDPVPSEANCRFCDAMIEDCPQKFVATETVDVLTSEF